MRRITDLGSLEGTTLGFSPDGRLLAVGDSSGVVNVYDADVVLTGSAEEVKPRKSIMNIVTSIGSLKFNHSSDILAMASSEQPNAIRLVSK